MPSPPGTVDLTGIDTVEDGVIDPTGSLTGVTRGNPTGSPGSARRAGRHGQRGGLARRDARLDRLRRPHGRGGVGRGQRRSSGKPIRIGLHAESRPANKGVEIGGHRGRDVIDGQRYAFVGAERGRTSSRSTTVDDAANPRFDPGAAR